MTTKYRKCFTALVVLFAGIMASACAIAGENNKPAPLTIQEQGGFAVGGTVISNPGTFDPYKMTPAGQTFHGDHAYVFYQIPVNARKLPLVLWHGAGQFSKTWGTTPDGREGFQNLFLRRGFAVYVIDQPRRGDAGRSTLPITITPTPDEQLSFDIFRLGIWPDFFPGVQFSRDPEALNQYFRQMTPNTGPFDMGVVSDAVAALFAKIGPGILVTHSQGGGPGWLTAIKSRNVRAVVAYEPGSGFLFPNGEVPHRWQVPQDLCRRVASPCRSSCSLRRSRSSFSMATTFRMHRRRIRARTTGGCAWPWRRLWADAVNRHGGDVTLVHLPEIGIRGNTHFPFSDLNNVEIANLLSKWLKEKGLD